MMKKWALMISIAAAAGSWAAFNAPAQEATPSTEKAALPQEVSSLAEDVTPAQRNNAFALKLLKAGWNDTENLFLSPYSIATALAMLERGAQGESAQELAHLLCWEKPGKPILDAFSKTQKELRDAPQRIRPQRDAEETLALSLANSLWPSESFPFFPGYIDSIKTQLDAEIHLSDYQNPEEVRTRINDWTALHTRDKIKDLIQPGVLDPMTRMVLVNAIYFKGQWIHTFNESATAEDEFLTGDGSRKKVPFMNKTETYSYYEDSELQVLSLPYHGRLSMKIFLPRDSGKLNAIKKSFCDGGFETWTKALKTRLVRVKLPKFKIEKRLDLNNLLTQLGAGSIFSEEKANFGGMYHRADFPNNLYVCKVIHQAFIEVDERGTEAAAATAAIMMARSAPMRQEVVSFVADHPFLFVLQDDITGNILFAGQMLQP
ncbi:MAG TPA: serpin family protein [Verrucomicrobiota bacterium]|jgi:serpin B|nr:serpin family protein [Verrucomicrobiota bacterium]